LDTGEIDLIEGAGWAMSFPSRDSFNDMEDSLDASAVGVLTGDHGDCGFGRGGNMPLREAVAVFFVELHGLLFGGDAGRKLGGVSASDLRKSLMGGRAAFLFLRRPSMGALSMTMNNEKESRKEIPKILNKGMQRFGSEQFTGRRARVKGARLCKESTTYAQ
jgi:hypothetical protein